MLEKISSAALVTALDRFTTLAYRSFSLGRSCQNKLRQSINKGSFKKILKRAHMGSNNTIKNL
jgi:hypothetical protein